ncbi:MAG: cysteine--tRNA ligase, partial [Parcubacteria group bacterium]
MVLKLFNTLTRKTSILRPAKPPLVTIYSCGPTVYTYPHIGNMRKYIADDVLVRALIYRHFSVKRLVNITDVG